MKRTGGGLCRLWFLLVLMLTVVSCSRGSDDRYLIPDGYVGPVIVLFDQVDGVVPSKEGSWRVFEIPADGVLRTTVSMSQLFNDDYYYVDAQGNRSLLAESKEGDLDVIQTFARVATSASYGFMVGRDDMWENPRGVVNLRLEDLVM